MWSFGIKGFLVFAFLSSVAYTRRILDPVEQYHPIEGSIYDRLVKSQATKDEKEAVIGSLKLIVAHVPYSTNWTHLADVIREGDLEENIDELGGERSRKAVTFLQQSLEGSGNVSEITSFLDTCLELVSMGNVTRIEKTLIMAESLEPFEYNTWYQRSSKLADVMGLKKDFVFPQEQIDYLINYWNDNPILRDSVLIDQLEKLSLMPGERGQSFLYPFYKFLLTIQHHDILYNFEGYLKNATQLDSFLLFNGVDEAFKGLLDPRLLHFNYTMIETIEKDLRRNPDFQTSLINQLNDTAIQEYFTRIDQDERYSTLHEYNWYFIPTVKDLTQSQLKALSVFFKDYPSLEKPTRIDFINLMNTKLTRKECWKVWKSQLLSKENEKMVKVINTLNSEFKLKACVLFNIRNTAQISKYWDNHLVPQTDLLKTLLTTDKRPKETFQILLTDTENPSRSSYIDFFRCLYNFNNPVFVDLVRTVHKIHKVDFDPIWMMMKQFSEFSEDQKNNFIHRNFANSTSIFGQFLKMIVPYSEKDLEVTVVKPKDQWTEKQIDGVLKIVEKLNMFVEYEIHGKIEDVLMLLKDGISNDECEKWLEYDKGSKQVDEMREMIFLMDELFGAMSCRKNVRKPWG